MIPSSILFHFFISSNCVSHHLVTEDHDFGRKGLLRCIEGHCLGSEGLKKDTEGHKKDTEGHKGDTEGHHLK